MPSFNTEPFNKVKNASSTFSKTLPRYVMRRLKCYIQEGKRLVISNQNVSNNQIKLY